MNRLDMARGLNDLASRARYAGARLRYSAVVHSPGRLYNGDSLQNAYDDVWEAQRRILGKTAVKRHRALRPLAVRGEAAARRHGDPLTAENMEHEIIRLGNTPVLQALTFVEDILTTPISAAALAQGAHDKLAISGGRYPQVGIERSEEAPHGYALKYVLYRKSDGSTVRGEPTDASNW
jgi:hypothetical protein